MRTLYQLFGPRPTLLSLNFSRNTDIREFF
jgi:hypothetical protein